MSLQIAQAAVDDATIHFDKLYSYCIPPRLNDKVWPGSMVLVPFGRGNKPRMAVVLSVAELPEDADTQKLKTLYDAAPAEARLTPDLLELVRFLKDRTFCTWFEAVKAVIPYGAQYRPAVVDGRHVMQGRLTRSTERLYTLAGALPEVTEDYVLTAEAPYDQMYRYYVEAQIHYANGETVRYNNAAAQWNNAFLTYKDYCCRTAAPRRTTAALHLF
mgnify:CR=1 FL=1